MQPIITEALLPFLPLRKVLTVLATAICAASFCYAQKPLTNSRQSSYYTYLYKLEPADVLNFYKFPDREPGDKILQHPVDSFKTDARWENTLPPGNYLKVYAEKNRLKYELVENHSAFINFFENNYDQRFVLLDKTGPAITNAIVTANGKQIQFDEKSKTYHFVTHKNKAIIRADYGGTANFYLAKERDVYRYNENNNKSWLGKLWASITKIFKKPVNNYNRYSNNTFQQKFTGFMVFNKPKYKPHDTVKFKAFIFDAKSKKPITEKELIIRLNDKIIGKVGSYRDGGFVYSIVLNDSLKLTLDSYYSVSLEYPVKKTKDEEDDDRRKRKILISSGFQYEDYELKATKFSMRVAQKENSPGNPQLVYLKATDENDLPVPDGRVTLTLTTSYNIKDYSATHVFVPDTLWVHHVDLDPIGETKVTVPDSVFPQASLNYDIKADFLNSSNEHLTRNEYASFVNKKYRIDTELSGDTLKAGYKVSGKSEAVSATVTALTTNDDTLSSVKIKLPANIIVNPYAASYEIETDSADTEFELKNQESGVSLSADRTADSLFVKVNNPANLHFWYSVFAHNKLIDAGEANQLFYQKAYHDPKIITFLVHYIWGGESKVVQATDLVYRKDKLNINVKQPLSVYPGQTAQTDIVVTDITGKPVPNTDLTAWSVTSKFDYYKMPNAPYIGRNYKARKLKTPFEREGLDAAGTIKLDWDKWRREIGLDSIAYYQFTHTKNIYKIEEPGPDTLTQIAPFVVKGGDIVPVHILYIDGRPVYFSQAQQLNPYSFEVTPGIHILRLRTAHENIKLDSVFVERSKKLILSVNADFPGATKVSDTLSKYEADLINKYMITMVDNFDQQMALVKQNSRIFFLNPQPGSKKTILTGPLADNYATFDLHGQKPLNFLTEPGYSYLFLPGLLKQKSIDRAYPFETALQNVPGTDNYKQYVVTQTAADSIWQQYLDLRRYMQQLFPNSRFTGPTGKLVFQRDVTKKQNPLLIRNVIIYRYDDPDFIRIYTGATTNFDNLPAGKYRILFLLKGDVYDIKENIEVQLYGTNFYKFRVTATHAKDSVSIKINNIINERTGFNKYNDGEIENDALKLKEAFNDKYLNTDTFDETITGKVTDEHDEPLIGATVKIKGTTIVTYADINGRFSFTGPTSGKLIVTYVGYNAVERAITPGKTMKIQMLELNKSMLQEVTVIGYGTQMKRDLKGAVSSITAGYTASGLMGKVAGLDISRNSADGSTRFVLRGNRTVGAGGAGQPLIIVDGVPVTELTNINPDDISNIDVLKEAAATALYGARAANGVIIVTTKKQNTNNSTSGGTQPTGEQSIRKNFADYAYWQPKLTTDANGKASFTTTYPDDITNWRTFVIGVNDNHQSGFKESNIKSFKPLSATFLAPLFAVQGDELSTLGKVSNYTSQDVQVARTFSYNGKVVKSDNLSVKNSKIDTLKVTAANTDSLTFEYTIKRHNGYFDGERRKIPVVEQGVKETKGIFEVLNADTTVHLQFDPALGPVTLRAEASVLPALVEEAQRLREYKYLCNEQLASKLKGLLAEKTVKTYLGEPYKWERNILEVIKKLQENRKSQGTWGWWKDTDEELWISLHAIEALLDAKSAGYKIDIDQQKLTDYLTYQLESYQGEEKMACLQLLHQLNAKIDYNKYNSIVKKELSMQKVVSRYDELRLMLLQEEAGITVPVDSLIAHSKHTLFGNIYWGEDSNRFFDNSIQVSLLAYQLLKKEGKHADVLAKIRGYFLEQRRAGEWRNTYETALILENILPDVLTADKQVKPSSLTLSGSKTETVTTFPYTATLGGYALNVSKTGRLPVYLTGYQQFMNYNPEKVSKDFTVDTRFEKNGNVLNKLKGGEPVLLKATVTAKGDADFVMVEIPIPAGCSYESKGQPYQNNEVRREYFKEKVSIFCRKLKQGTYAFTVNLIPRYGGNYNLNPAKAEMMYFPVFYGREGMKKVMIGQ